MKWWWWRDKLLVNHNSSSSCPHSSPTATVLPGQSVGEGETTLRWVRNDGCSRDRRWGTQNNQLKWCSLLLFSSAEGSSAPPANKLLIAARRGRVLTRGRGHIDLCRLSPEAAIIVHFTQLLLKNNTFTNMTAFVCMYQSMPDIVSVKKKSLLVPVVVLLTWPSKRSWSAHFLVCS